MASSILMSRCPFSVFLLLHLLYAMLFENQHKSSFLNIGVTFVLEETQVFVTLIGDLEQILNYHV